MALTNNLKPIVDVPVWEWCRFAPTATATLSALCTSDDGNNRFIYYLTGTTFYRYDTYADTWQQLATPNVAASTVLSMRYTGLRGVHGRILSSTNTSVTIGGMRGPTLNAQTMRIEMGAGTGQERVLTFASETIHEWGVLTTGAATVITDTTKKWKYNQWAGYVVGITYGTGVTCYKEILYNDTNALYVSDVNLMPHNPWDNQPYAANAPYAIPVGTNDATKSHYQITSQTFTVSAWGVNPNYTSTYTTLSGGIWLLSSSTTAPFMTLQYYDVLSDNWQTKTVTQGILPAALATDCSIERFSKFSSYISSTVTSGTSRTVVDTTQNLEIDRYKNYRIEVTAPDGTRQHRRITCNTATTFTVYRNWDTTPDATYTYKIYNDYNKLMVAAGGLSALSAYNIRQDYWSNGAWFDDGVVNNIAVRMNGWESLGVTSGVRIAAGVQSVASTPTVKGTGYLVGDILTCSVGGTGAKVIVTSISPGGLVETIELVAAGTVTGFTTGTGKATSGGTGTGCTINITAVGPTCLVTLPTASWFKTGDSVTFSGCSESAYNTAHTIIGVSAVSTTTTTFDVVTSATSNMAASNSNGTTLIVDSSKNWVPGEHVGRLVHLCVAGTAPTAQVRWITANTATTLTVATITQGVIGTSKYCIYDAKSYGTDDQFKQANKASYGHCTGGSSTTTLVDTTKDWTVNQWAGYLFKIEAGTGFGSGRISIISNTATTLTFAAQTFTPDATSHYEIADSWGLISTGGTTTHTEATSKNWVVNQWSGKRFRVTAGAGLNQEATVVTNTATQITTATLTTTDNTSAYCIYGCPVKGAGFQLIHIFGTTNTSQNGRIMFLPRGASSNTADIYDIPKDRWVYGYLFTPQQELQGTGTKYAYDGVNTVYFSKAVLGANARIFAYNLLTNDIKCVGTAPYNDSTLIIGNRMEIIQTADGLKYLYIMRDSGAEMFRMLTFF